MEDIIKHLESLIRDSMDDDSIILTRDTRFEEIEEWDSMEQVAVISMVEKLFGFKFTVQEMTAMSMAESVGKMAGIIAGKLE